MCAQNDSGIPRDTSFTTSGAFIKAKKQYPFIRPAVPAEFQNMIKYENVVYKTIEVSSEQPRNLRINIYRINDNKKRPALLMIHGGGWSSGDFSMQIPMAVQIASRGYVAVPVEYRLSPEAIYPAAVHDIKSAVKWLRKHADTYNIDPDFIAVSGCSAGGQLANLIGTTNGLKKYEDPNNDSNVSSDVQAIVNIDGISDFTSEESITRSLKAEGTSKQPADVIWLGGSYGEVPEIWKDASPIFHVSENSAPICFINSSIPRFHYGRDEMIRKLNTYNIYSEVHTIPDTPHPFWLFHPWFTTTIDYITDFLDKTGIQLKIKS
jgi:acetyl esterase/lipase